MLQSVNFLVCKTAENLRIWLVFNNTCDILDMLLLNTRMNLIRIKLYQSNETKFENIKVNMNVFSRNIEHKFPCMCQTADNLRTWLVFDYASDAVYLLDILLFNTRVKFIDDGLWVHEPSDIRIHYIKTNRFKVRGILVQVK